METVKPGTTEGEYRDGLELKHHAGLNLQSSYLTSPNRRAGLPQNVVPTLSRYLLQGMGELVNKKAVT